MAAQDQYESLIKIHVVPYCVILKMPMNIKDLYGNSAKKFKNIKYSLEFSITYTLPYLLLLLVFPSCLVIFPIHAILSILAVSFNPKSLLTS